MSTRVKILGSSSLTSSFSSTLPKRVRKELNVKKGDIIGFYLEEDGSILISKSGTDLLGSSSLTSTFSFTVPKKVREKLNIAQGDIVGFYMKENGSIMIKT